jgi:hypothetical protein
MNKATISSVGVAGCRDRPNSTPSSAIANMKARQVAKIGELRESLVGEGFDTFSNQATVLGLGRSTAWSVLRADYKQSGVTAGVIKRMLAYPNLPVRARHVLEQYVHETLLGTYGHNPVRLKSFRKQLGLRERPRHTFSPKGSKANHAGGANQIVNEHNVACWHS